MMRMLLGFALFAFVGCASSGDEGDPARWSIEDIREDEWISISNVMLQEEVRDYVSAMKNEGWTLLSAESASDIPGRYIVRMKKPDEVKIRKRRTRPLGGRE